MDDFGMFVRDLGFRPQGKSAPMKSSGVGSNRSPATSSSPFSDYQFSDVFGGPPKYSSSNDNNNNNTSDFIYDSIFKSSATNESNNNFNSASSVPVYDDDIFDGLPGLKTKSVPASSKHDENVFASISLPSWKQSGGDQFDDLLGNSGREEKAEPEENIYKSSRAKYDENVFASISLPSWKQSGGDQFDDLLGNLGREDKAEPKENIYKSSRDFDELIPGFGSGSPSNRPNLESSQTRTPKPTGNAKHTYKVMDDPFVVLESSRSTSTPGVSSPGFSNDPLEDMGKLRKSVNTKPDISSVSGGVFDDIDSLDGLSKSVSAHSSEKNNTGNGGSPSRAGSSMRRAQDSAGNEAFGRSSFNYYSESQSQRKMHVDEYQESHQTLFDMPTASNDSQKSFGQSASSPSYVNANLNETNSQVDMSPRSEEHFKSSDDVWLTISEIPLFTQPTIAPPPSRPPPPIPRHTVKSERDFYASNARNKSYDYSSSTNSVQSSQSPKPFRPAAKNPTVSLIDELEDFAMTRNRSNVNENVDIHSNEDISTNSAAVASAAAMKEAMDRAEAKFRHAKEIREREHAKAGRSKEGVQLEKDEQEIQEEFRENEERLNHEQRQREQEEEREQRRLENEAARQIEREKARQAVERATREARERAVKEARERAAADARLKTERAAVQRAQAEARERAAAEARDRAERAAAEARERANAEAREKETQEKVAIARAEADARRRAERAAVDRVTAAARERAAAEARERAAATAAARTNQQKNENDLESFFSTGSRPSSAPRPRASDPLFDRQFQSRGGPDGARKTSQSGVSSNMKKASSTTNIVDDLSSIFGAAPSTGEFQDVEGETEERRRARLERHQRTQERTAKALAEKNQRDLQTQRDQEERHRIAETLDFEIKRWAAGKEGNLRALLSTLQYVLWPECGWQPVSLTDLITGASVKKIYRKATLCIHPDKVQQKGANLQQKYIAEKVFDLLKEAWNKFNSEELF